MEATIDNFDMDAWVAAIGKDGSLPFVTISTGKDVEIKKVSPVQLVLVLDLLKALTKHLKIKKLDDLADIAASIEEPVQFLEMCSQSMEPLLKLVSALSNLNEETVKKGLDLDDLIFVIWAQWEVNKSFFTKRLLPMIQKLGTGQSADALRPLSAPDVSLATGS